MVSYGWTIDYINESVTIAQIVSLLEVIRQNPPVQIMSFELGQKSQESKLLKQLDGLGDKVQTIRWFDKDSVKSVVRKRDGAKIK